MPWSEGRTFDGPLAGEAWAPKDSTLPEVARTALIVNLLTEDNLPSYHHQIATLFGRDGAWGTWVNRWTAEEGRHGTAIRDYLTVTRAVDPVALERARMVHMGAGYSNAHDHEVLRSLAYVSFQELATRISHRNTGRATGDPTCEALLARVAADENLHMVFYRNLLAAAFELAPSQTMRAVAEVLADFQMPGVGIEGFARKSVTIALAGIYDLRQHRDEVLVPVLRQWDVFNVAGLDADGEAAREEIAGSSTAWSGRRPASRRSATPATPASTPGRADAGAGPGDCAPGPAWRLLGAQPARAQQPPEQRQAQRGHQQHHTRAQPAHHGDRTPVQAYRQLRQPQQDGAEHPAGEHGQGQAEEHRNPGLPEQRRAQGAPPGAEGDQGGEQTPAVPAAVPAW